MASTSCPTPTATVDRPLPLESLPAVDLRYLSQSELYALSLCSDSAFDPYRSDDVVIPKIDRSVFNESAGSRKQTYSRLRLAPAASSVSSICRRTPHLRVPKPSSIETDPERAENSKIVNMLKALFSSEGNGGDLAPIEVEQSNPVPDLANSTADFYNSRADIPNSMTDFSNSRPGLSNSMVDLSNPVNFGLKRKRGRPRKDENAAVPAKIEVKDIFIYDNVEKKDDNVDFYSSNTAVDGDDNSSVRKRRRGRPRKEGTDADVFPVKNDVKEIVVHKNKAEESDKEVVNSKGVTVDVAALAGLEDPFGPEIKRRTAGMSMEAELLGFLEALPGRWGSRRRKRKIIDANTFGDYLPKGWNISISLKRKGGNVWLFCRRYISPTGRQFISCKEISSYLLSISGVQAQNQPNSSHGNGSEQFADKMDSRNGIVQPADVAVKGDPTERNHYDGHVGDRVNNGLMDAEKVTIEHVQEKVWSSSVGEVANGDFTEANVLVDKDMVLAKSGTNGNDDLDSDDCNNKQETSLSVEISCDKVGNEQRYVAEGNPDLQASKIGLDREDASYKQKADCPSSSDQVDNVSEFTDKHATGSNLCLGSEDTLTNNNNLCVRVTPARSNAVAFGSDAINTCSVEQESSLQVCVPSAQINDQICSHVENNGIEDSAVLEEPYKEVVTGNPCYTENLLLTTTTDYLKLDAVEVARMESISGFNKDPTVLDKHCESAVEQHSIKGVSPSASGSERFSNLDNVITCALTESEQKICFESSILVPSGDEEFCIDNNVKSVTTLSIAPEQIRVHNYGSNDRGSYAEPDTDVVGSLEEERKYGDFPAVSLLIERDQVDGSSTMAYESRQKVSLSSLLSLSGHEEKCSAENLVDLPARNMDNAECNEGGTARNNELIISPGRTYYDVGADMTSNMGTSLELSSLLPSGKKATFGVEDNATGVDNSSVEECRHQFSGSDLLSRSCFGESPNNVYSVDKIYNRNELKFDSGQNSSCHNLALAFGDPHSGLYADSTSLEHQKFPANCSAIPSRFEQNIGAQINVDRVNHNFVEEQGIGSLSGLFSLSNNGKFWGSESSFNPPYNRRWDMPEENAVGNSSNKNFTAAFGSDNEQPGENVLSSGTWRAGEDFQSNMANISNPPMQSPTAFCNFGILSDKAEDGLYRLGRESCFEGIGSNRAEPVEFSFLTTQNSTDFQRDSERISYNTGMEQPYDSPYWLGKHDMGQNISSRSQVTTLCVWCRNEFHQELVHSGTQSAVGSMCPTCRARISEQVNVL